MTFRAIVRDGLIVINTHGALPDGTPVEVVRAAGPPRRALSKAAARKKPPASPKRAAKARARKRPARGSIADAPFFGIWKDRPEWKGKTTLEIAAELRRRAMGRHAGS